MKQKNSKRRKPQRTARRKTRAGYGKRGESRQNARVECVATPWLRMVPAAIEDELSTDISNRFLSPRNGRRQARDLDLYVPEDNFRRR
jgi:hypothetical protein